MAGPRRRTHRPVDERRSVAHVRADRDAPAQAVTSSKARCQPVIPSRDCSTVDAVDRQGRQGHSLSDALLELVPRVRHLPGACDRRQVAMMRCTRHRGGGSDRRARDIGACLCTGVDGVRQQGRSVHDQLPRRARQVRESTFTSQFGADLPSRVYSATRGASRFSVTVVDYRPSREDPDGEIQVLSRWCRDLPRRGQPRSSSTGAGYWKADRAGAVIHATWQFMQRDATVTYFNWNNVDLVEGHMLTLTNNKRTSRARPRRSTCTKPALHSRRDCSRRLSGPRGSSSSQSRGSTRTATSIRYQTLYHNGFPKPPRSR